MYQLHPQLAQDTLFVGRLALSDILLMNDARYPWVILVPRKASVSEIYQLELEEQQQLLAESSLVAETLAKLFSADKMNVAALGNMVPQLHLHIIVRFKTDDAWPKPVWSLGDAIAYTEQESPTVISALQNALSDYLINEF